MSTPYTHLPLADVPDIAPQIGIPAPYELRFGREALGAERTGFALHAIPPGGGGGLGHRHEEAEEVYVVLKGSGHVKLDDEVRALQERDALRVSPEVIRGFTAGPEGLELLVFGAHHPADGELFQDWWPER